MSAIRTASALLLLAAVDAFAPLPDNCAKFVRSVGGICEFAGTYEHTCYGAHEQLDNRLTASGQATLDADVSVQGVFGEDTYTLFDLCALSIATRETCPRACVGEAGDAHARPTEAMEKNKRLLCSFEQFKLCCDADAPADCLAATSADSTLQSFPTLQLLFPPMVDAGPLPDGRHGIHAELDISVVTVAFPGGNASGDNTSGISAKLAWEQRTYGYNRQGPGTNAPVYRLKAGDDLFLNVTNSICDPTSEDPKESCMYPNQLDSYGENVLYWINKFRLFDATNLHTHGLHVGSRAPGDDIYTLYPSGGQTYPRNDTLPDWHMPVSPLPPPPLEIFFF